MSWVRRTEPPAHTCVPPMRGWQFAVGKPGDLWRCDDPHCGELWRVGRRCDACDAYGPGQHRGQCMVGTTWREATFWQRIRNRRTR